MTGLRPITVLAASLLWLAGCGPATPLAATETLQPGPLVLAVEGEGQLRSAKATPLTVPGANWATRRVEWMLPEGSRVGKGELLARFSADSGKQALDQAMLDLQRNALGRSAKQDELASARGRVDVDLSQVAVQLAIAQRYADADLDILARNDVLDAVQDVNYLHARQGTLQWQRGQSGTRGGAELAVLDAQRATFALEARNRQDDLDALELRAPNDGVLLLSANWSGDKPMPGTSLYAGSEYGNLPDTSAMEVEIALPQIEAQGIKAGNVVEISPVGMPGQKITSKLSWVASAAKVSGRESPVKYLSMRAPVPADAVRRFQLVPGQRMQARVILLQAKDALSVANVALRNEDGKLVVQRRDGSGFSRHEVKLGVRGSARSQVLGGLRAGDVVLLAHAASDAPVAASPGEEPVAAAAGNDKGAAP